MKKLLLFLIIGLAAWSCKEAELPVNNCIQVKLVEELCGQAILQVMDPAYYGIAEDSWQNSNGDVLNHVFSTNLACQQIPTDGSVFYVKLESEMPQTLASCIVCKALLAHTPSTFHYVSIQTNCATDAQPFD